ncbi:hypothetical protein HII36_21855 [Nonomuraea sp. NN258]|uniref:hypothetical protein n=1 Tax=Nonomuraea antri TaxID=2730852 RepID=UPI0015697845|nr:hypothetical protein [Nonomuraea antri]NRQ34477.1 hypothetical protein [Nonomuraea antri]
MVRRREPTDPRQVTFQSPDNSEPLAKPRTRSTPTRTKKAQWTQLINTGTRLDAHTNERLDNVCASTGLGLQQVWETAINYYCDQFDPPIPKTMPDQTDLDIPRFTRRASVDEEEETLVTARITPNTRARLVEACHRQHEPGRVVIPAALNAWFDHLDKGGRRSW